MDIFLINKPLNYNKYNNQILNKNYKKLNNLMRIKRK